MTPARDTFRLVVAYQGTRFAGYQRQAAQRTVQDVLEQAAQTLAHDAPALTCAGRTDAGVHARGQVVSCVMTARPPLERMVLAFNALLPEDVAVRSAQKMPEGFCARRHAVGKRYVYRVLTGPARDPFVREVAWHHKGALDVDAMQAGARHLVGEHDFESFRASSCQAAHARRYVWKVEVTRAAHEVHIDVRGNAFCQNMVRIIAGTLVEVGRGRHRPDDVAAMLAEKTREAAGQTAPAHGLCFDRVYYPDALDDADIPDRARFPRYPVTTETWPFGNVTA